MLGKKQIVTMVSIAIMSFLVGTTVNFVAVASDRNPFDKIWEVIYDLQARVTALEQGASTKTWHYVTSFTLSSDNRVSPPFFIEGEKWRIKWEPQPPLGSWYGFFIWDEKGYAIEWVQVDAILMYYHEARGIHYVPHGTGSYKIEWLSGPSVNFTIESYH